jgi:hypothetical protein
VINAENYQKLKASSNKNPKATLTQLDAHKKVAKESYNGAKEDWRPRMQDWKKCK